MMHGVVALVAAFSLVAVSFANTNEYVISSSRPEQVDASLIFFDEISSTGATIKWTEPGLGDWEWPITGYKIRVRTNHSTDYVELTGVYTTDEEHTVYDLTANTLYYYQILAYNHDGDGAWSEDSYALHTHAVPNKPETPTLVVNTDTTVELTLTYPVTTGSNDCEDISLKDFENNICTTDGEGTPVVAYRIQVDSGDGNGFSEILDPETGISLYPISVTSDEDVGETQTYTITGLTPNTEYLFRYAASNVVGEGSYSEDISVTTFDVPDQSLPPNSLGVTSDSVTLTWMTPDDNGVPIVSYRIFAQSCTPTNSDDHDSDDCADSDDSDYFVASRGTLTSSSEGYTYAANPLDTELPAGMSTDSWLEINTPDVYDPDTDSSFFTIEYLTSDTYYKFRIIFTNGVGDSIVSDSSIGFLTLESTVTEIKAYSGPPCIYEDGSPTRFVAMSDGTNTEYKWELTGGSVIAEDDGDECVTTDCSIMEYVFSEIGDHSIDLIGYNERGQLSVTTEYAVEYCGCMNIWDANYWSHATFHLPMMCEHENWDGADKTVGAGEMLYFEFWYEESTHEVDIDIRIDEGMVDLFVSTSDTPNPDMEWTYEHATLGISDWLSTTIPYKYLYGGRSLILGVRGDADTSFSRFEIVTSSSEFTRGYTSGGDYVIDDPRRTMLANIEPQTFELNSGYIDFFEYYFAEADNDMDVEILVTVERGCVDVFTSQQERYPSARRATDDEYCNEDDACDETGYWYSTTANCAQDSQQVLDYTYSFSVMHTIKPEDSRVLYVAVEGSQDYNIGDDQEANEYEIEAKVYRYRIDSNLMEPSESDGSVMEDYRYSTVSIDNFNYYELKLGTAGFAFTVEIDLQYGDIDLFTSSTKLPTQDPHEGAGYDKFYGNFQEGLNYFDINYDEINPDGGYIFVGILGKTDDAAYTITVNETAFDNVEYIDLCDNERYLGGACYTGGEIDSSFTVEEDEYTFAQIYVGPEDEYMETTYRSHAGSRTSSLGTDPDTWGIDWTEPLTQTWIEQQADEHDMDVEIDIQLQGDYDDDHIIVYASSREPYPSVERGYDTMAVLTSGEILSVPHFTFSDKLVYFSIISNTTTQVSIMANIKENLPDEVTSDVDTVRDTCPGNFTGEDGESYVCSAHGSCVEGICYCDDGYLGDACEVVAFSSDEDQPQIYQIDADAWEGYEYEVVPIFAGDDNVTLSYRVDNAPEYSYVQVYVDGAAYPADRANTIYLDYEDSIDGSITVYGALANVTHTVELILISEEGIPLGTLLRQFQVNFVGGCANSCSGNGVCHHGYCICYDGYGGESCEQQCGTEDYLEDCSDITVTPGQGYITYNQHLLEQEGLVDQLVNSMKMDAVNVQLARSDALIDSEYQNVVETLAGHHADLEASMESLKAQQAASADALYRRRDKMRTSIMQMREESLRLQTENEEAYNDKVRDLLEYQQEVQNNLDLKRRAHAEKMALKADEWKEIKERNDFKLNQLRTANGPLESIEDLEVRECTQDDSFGIDCVSVDASDSFEFGAGYVSYGTGEWVGDEYIVDGEYVIGEYNDIPR